MAKKFIKNDVSDAPLVHGLNRPCVQEIMLLVASVLLFIYVNIRAQLADSHDTWNKGIFAVSLTQRSITFNFVLSVLNF